MSAYLVADFTAVLDKIVSCNYLKKFVKIIFDKNPYLKSQLNSPNKTIEDKSLVLSS